MPAKFIHVTFVDLIVLQGIGLFLCKSLVENLGGDIRLDESYDSGIPGQPGARFVIDLRAPPIEVDADTLAKYNDKDGMGNGTRRLLDEEKALPCVTRELPVTLSVLFVDDDPILRKLFSRMVKTVAPQWEIREAASGEAAMRLTDAQGTCFDLIFVGKLLVADAAAANLRYRVVAHTPKTDVRTTS